MIDKSPYAFPVASDLIGHHGGMSLRDWFAGQALALAMQDTYGLDWGKMNKDWTARVSHRAYQIADAMLDAREEE